MSAPYDWVPRYAPTTVMTARGHQPVIRAVWHPPGHHKGPIRSGVGALELVTPAGSRWYGAEAGAINAQLRMVITGFPAAFEEMRAWKKVPARFVPPVFSSRRRSHGDMKFGAGHPLPPGATFTVKATTLKAKPDVWYVVGPRVVRGGRVDYNTSAYYGTINKKTGELHVWGGRGAAGEFYRTYLEVVRDRIKRRLKIASRHTGEPLVRVARDAVALGARSR